jgi:hypothetical protein
MKKEYVVENFSKFYEPLKSFVFLNTNILRLTRAPWKEFNFLRFHSKGDDNDPKVMEVLASLEDLFIKKEINNKKYNDVAQSAKARVEHRYYKLTNELKAILDRVKFMVNRDDEEFYGFEDATFYLDDELVCCVISHENMAILRLKDSEASELEKNGVRLDEIEAN